MTRYILLFLALATMGAAFPSVARAQAADYPSRQIRLVVPYAPGGIADLLGRVVAQPLGATPAFRTCRPLQR